MTSLIQKQYRVAPLVGAWIEITFLAYRSAKIPSLPSWERGLKLHTSLLIHNQNDVAPLVGAWIEILLGAVVSGAAAGRSPRGSVD